MKIVNLINTTTHEMAVHDVTRPIPMYIRTDHCARVSNDHSMLEPLCNDVDVRNINIHKMIDHAGNTNYVAIHPLADEFYRSMESTIHDFRCMNNALSDDLNEYKRKCSSIRAAHNITRFKLVNVAGAYNRDIMSIRKMGFFGRLVYVFTGKVQR